QRIQRDEMRPRRPRRDRADDPARARRPGHGGTGRQRLQDPREIVEHRQHLFRRPRLQRRRHLPLRSQRLQPGRLPSDRRKNRGLGELSAAAEVRPDAWLRRPRRIWSFVVILVAIAAGVAVLLPIAGRAGADEGATAYIWVLPFSVLFTSPYLFFA